MTAIIMDADPGVDDLAAILLALASPELSVLGVTTVAGNVPVEASAANACKALALAGRKDVPVFAGCSRPLVRAQIFGKHAYLGAFPDHVVPATDKRPEPAHAVSFIADAARQAVASGTPLTICATGPLTNLAMALTLDENVKAGIARIVIMGGAFTALGNRAPWAEMNMLADPHAAHAVLASGVPVSLFPLDVTLQALVEDSHLQRMREGAGRAGRALADLFQLSDRSDIDRYGRPGGPIHDIMPVAFLLAPELFEMRHAAIGVETGDHTMGHTYADFSGEAAAAGSAEIARRVDDQALLSLLLDRLETYASKNASTAEIRP
ncbi:purine nucleosidase [Faunimonas pinastri]|uniref:Purine nucleosidase n=1 Tax=Faunimonas pinastri TaxID=1855383 RepID=A0A1H9LBF2_9HYPH|nr:nucleoside hydrolase [Faunimonas pinastri]SER08668.1 purine nucleosidase [Faunimonas pinastri]